MTDSGGAHPLADAQFVSLVTYKRSGDAVASPVWIAPAADGSDRLVVITNDHTWKVKRLERNPRVTLRPCSASGHIAHGAPTYRGNGRVTRDPAEIAVVQRSMRRKYGLMYRLFSVGSMAVRLVRQREAHVGLWLHVDRRPVVARADS